MKIADLFETYLKEDLGNLAQLQVGPLIDILKQAGTTDRHNRAVVSPVGRSFDRWGAQSIGSTSEIIDVGVLKDGIKTLRKVFKINEARGFAIYIGGKAVMFGVTDSETLAGSSRSGKIAYDLRPFEEKWKEIHTRDHKGWGNPFIPKLTTFKVEEPHEWEKEEGNVKPKYYMGEMISTGELSELIRKILIIGQELNLPVTAKLVIEDETGIAKRRKRYSQQEIENGAKDLATRLAIYKNQKNPTVNTIRDFIKMSLTRPGKNVRFAGTTYKLAQTSYDKIGVIDLLKGATFKTSYNSVDPDSYGGLYLTYRYDNASNQLLPFKAEWYDKTDPTNTISQEAVLDPKGYISNAIKVHKLEKTLVIPKLLELFRTENVYKYKILLNTLDSLKQLNIDWPELDTIRKSVELENSKQSSYYIFSGSIGGSWRCH